MKNLGLFNILLYLSTSVSWLLVNNLASSNPATNTQVKVPDFYVNVTLSNKAQRKLEADKETIIVSATFYGEPKKNSSVPVNEVGLVDLGNHQIELPKAGQAQFNNLSVSASRVSQLANQDYQVNVNVYSGRRSSPDNLLDCDFFDNNFSKIQPGITLKCRLINE